MLPFAIVNREMLPLVIVNREMLPFVLHVHVSCASLLSVVQSLASKGQQGRRASDVRQLHQQPPFP